MPKLQFQEITAEEEEVERNIKPLERMAQYGRIPFFFISIQIYHSLLSYNYYFLNPAPEKNRPAGENHLPVPHQMGPAVDG